MQNPRQQWHRLAMQARRWFVEERGYRWFMVAWACAVVEFCYVFISSAGRFADWPSHDIRIDQLAEAFRAGQLHLLVEPSPELLALPNPFDPANRHLWLWDSILYEGHYYWYWGPVPSLLLAAVKSVFRISKPLGDEYTTFALASLQLLAGAVLLERFARRLFGGIPSVLVVLAVLAFGLANPMPFVLARQCVYEVSIIGGHAFLLTGIASAFEAVCCAPAPRRSLGFAAAAGASWALALGCRISIAPVLPLLAVATAAALAWQGRQRWKHALLALVAIGVPLTLGVGALLAYNKARFEQWFEFGLNHQLTFFNFGLSKAYIAANVYSYALRPVQIACKFPFVFSSLHMKPEQVFPEWFPLPPQYAVIEQVAGVFVTTPWAWLVVPSLVLLGRALWRAARRTAGLDAASVPTIWALCALLLASTTTLAIPLWAPSATMRYLGDVMGACLLFASLGAFAIYSALRRAVARRWLAVALLSGAAFISAGFGMALGIEGYFKFFRTYNPSFLQQLEERYSVCTEPTG